MAASALIRALADLEPAAVWLAGIVVGLVAVFVGFIGVVLVAALKADTSELQRYRSTLLRELLRFMRDMLRALLGGKE